MARTKKDAAPAASTLKELKDTLWAAANKLRGSMSSSQYKDVVLGLVFLKYVSDAFAARADAIAAELASEGYDPDAIADIQEDPDEYLGHGVLFVHPEARWEYLAGKAKVNDGETIGRRLVDAMDLLMRDNPGLQGTLPRLFNGSNVDQVRLASLIDLFNTVQFTGEGAERARDLLGEVYEYFLGKFAAAEGQRGGEYYTPASVVRVIVEMLQPREGRVYDPCCGSGGMFVQAEKFLAAHADDPTKLSIFGQELNQTTWQLAKMNTVIHGFTADLGPTWGDTFAIDLHAGKRMDYVMANPPFNLKDWARNERDARWTYGVPPVKNANYAWLQHIISHLAPTGTAGVVMANGSMTSNTNGEGEIRAAMVEGDIVSCMVALPERLFRTTGIPVCLWFFARDKSAGKGGSIDRRGEVLFIDARGLGHMVTRAERAFSDADIARIAETYHAWRGIESLGIGTKDASETGEGADAEPVPQISEYADVPGFCRSVTLAEIKDAGYALTPGRYVGSAAVENTVDADAEIARLTALLQEQFAESDRLQRNVLEQLGRLQ